MWKKQYPTGTDVAAHIYSVQEVQVGLSLFFFFCYQPPPPVHSVGACPKLSERQQKTRHGPPEKNSHRKKADANYASAPFFQSSRAQAFPVPVKFVKTH